VVVVHVAYIVSRFAVMLLKTDVSYFNEKQKLNFAVTILYLVIIVAAICVETYGLIMGIHLEPRNTKILKGAYARVNALLATKHRESTLVEEQLDYAMRIWREKRDRLFNDRFSVFGYVSYMMWNDPKPSREKIYGKLSKKYFFLPLKALIAAALGFCILTVAFLIAMTGIPDVTRFIRRAAVLFGGPISDNAFIALQTVLYCFTIAGYVIFCRSIRITLSVFRGLVEKLRRGEYPVDVEYINQFNLLSSAPFVGYQGFLPTSGFVVLQVLIYIVMAMIVFYFAWLSSDSENAGKSGAVAGRLLALFVVVPFLTVFVYTNPWLIRTMSNDGRFGVKTIKGLRIYFIVDVLVVLFLALTGIGLVLKRVVKNFTSTFLDAFSIYKTSAHKEGWITDIAYKSFIALVIEENAFRHPVLIAFAHMLCERYCKEEMDEKRKVKNWIGSYGMDSEVTECLSASSTRFRVQKRFWLYYILSVNPSLQKYRERALQIRKAKENLGRVMYIVPSAQEASNLFNEGIRVPLLDKEAFEAFCSDQAR